MEVQVSDVFEEFLGDKRWFGDGTTEIDVVLLRASAAKAINAAWEAY